ncbi:hypothetical protein CR51_31230 [Caballeronia megalochromosomata]|nr:hypothetical protein CR51_31230 [Caballeronia megalochromosomata]
MASQALSVHRQSSPTAQRSSSVLGVHNRTAMLMLIAAAVLTGMSSLWCRWAGSSVSSRMKSTMEKKIHSAVKIAMASLRCMEKRCA